MNGRTPQQHDFKGLADWVEVFRAGEQTDSQGRKQVWTAADLDQMVSNHSAAAAAPIVVGHPQHNDPAYGWVDQLQREGDSLRAKFRDVTPEFAQAVDAGHYRTRSVRVAKGPNGWFIDHVGFLGAQRPAIALDPLNYQAPTGEIHDYEMGAELDAFAILARQQRRTREFLIEKFGQEAADRVMPDWELQQLSDLAAAMRAEADESNDLPSSAFSKGDPTMPTTDELEAARKQAADLAAQNQELQRQLAATQRAARQADFQAFHANLVSQGHAPAKLAGMCDFMHHLAGAEDATFEFSAAGGQPKKVKPLDWFRDFAQQVKPDVHLGPADLGEAPDGSRAGEFAAGSGLAVDADRLAIHQKAIDYQRANKGVDYLTAVRAVGG